MTHGFSQEEIKQLLIDAAKKRGGIPPQDRIGMGQSPPSVSLIVEGQTVRAEVTHYDYIPDYNNPYDY